MRLKIGELAKNVGAGPNVLSWLATITLAGVLPHEGMLPVGLLSFCVLLPSH